MDQICQDLLTDPFFYSSTEHIPLGNLCALLFNSESGPAPDSSTARDTRSKQR